MSKKKIITVTLSEISPYELEGTLSQIMAQIQTWSEQYGPTARLNWDPDNWRQYDDSPSPQFEIKVDREENDAEYNDRIVKEAAQKIAQLEWDKKELARLKKQFGEK